MNVKHIRLVTGESLLYKEVKRLSSDESSILVEDPVMIVQHRGSNGEMLVALVPYLPFLKETISSIPKANIISNPASVDTQLEAEYIKQFSLIQVAPANSILV
jgi:hypothetical protein